MKIVHIESYFIFLVLIFTFLFISCSQNDIAKVKTEKEQVKNSEQEISVPPEIDINKLPIIKNVFVSIANNEIKIDIPIDEKYNEIEMYRDYISDNSLEYAWSTSFKISDYSYAFGLYLFKPPDADTQLKHVPFPFSTFIQIAQTTLWKNKRMDGNYVDDPTLISSFNNNVLSISSKNTAVIKQILSIRPEFAKYEQIDGRKEKSYRVKIKY